MNLWRLEWLRLTRTKRWIGLVGVFVFFGFLGPITARYTEQILKNFGGNIQITVPPPVPADGITQYISNAFQVGLLVAVGIAAGALAFDAKPQMGIFLRTRVHKVQDIIVPRYIVMTLAVVAGFTLGSIAALYESVVLIGSLSFVGWLLGTLLGALYLAFAVAVVALVASRASSVLLTMVTSIVILLLLPVIGVVPAIGKWLPSQLVGAIDGLVRDGAFTDYLGAALVTVVLTIGALLVAIRWAEHREL
jgi:ABC-2 type transport system permease protein